MTAGGSVDELAGVGGAVCRGEGLRRDRAGYSGTRRSDPRIAAQVCDALADVASVVSVGSGTGSNEPCCTVVGVEPSAVMVAQRPGGAAPCVRGAAEALSLADGSVDAALAVLTVHHWTNVARGVAEMRRVARRRVVILTWEGWAGERLPRGGPGRSDGSDGPRGRGKRSGARLCLGGRVAERRRGPDHRAGTCLPGAAARPVHQLIRG